MEEKSWQGLKGLERREGHQENVLLAFGDLETKGWEVGEPDWRSKEGTVYRDSLKIIAADVYRTLSTELPAPIFRNHPLEKWGGCGETFITCSHLVFPALFEKLFSMFSLPQ